MPVCWSAGVFAPKYHHVLQTKMADCDGNSARAILTQIAGSIGELSAALNQQGEQQAAAGTAKTIEDEVRTIFGSAREARPVPAPVNSMPLSGTSSSLVNTSHQSGPLYTMRRNFSSFRSANYRSSRKGKSKAAKPTGSFTRDVILLTGPYDEDVPRQGNRVYLQERGHVIMAFSFKKEWNETEVGIQLREAFQDIVLLDFLIDFEILQSVHTKLLKPTLAPGQYLTGAMIHRIFREKPVYVRPNKQILKPLKPRKCEDDGSEVDELDGLGTPPTLPSKSGSVPNNKGHMPDVNCLSAENIPSYSASNNKGHMDANCTSAENIPSYSASYNKGHMLDVNFSSAENIPSYSASNNKGHMDVNFSSAENIPSNSASYNKGHMLDVNFSSAENIPSYSASNNKGHMDANCTSAENIPSYSASNNNDSVDTNNYCSAYNNYVEVIYENWDDNDDPNLIAAIEASLVDQNIKNVEPLEKEEVDDVLRKFISDNLQTEGEDDFVNVLISRKNVLSSTLQAIERKAFSFFKPVHVSFSGEEAVDAGGPRREFFRLLMSSLKNLGIFQGKWFSHDLHLLHSKKYALAGKLVAWCILQGGSGPRCLSQEAFLVMSDLPVKPEDAITAVSDEELKKILHELQSCSTSDKFSTLVQMKSDAIAGLGYSKIYTSDISKKDEIVQCLLKQAFVFSVHAEVEQFWDGLNSIGRFGHLLMGSPNLFAAVLGDGRTSLNTKILKKLYNIEFSDEGSNQKDKEEKTMYCFELFLQDLEEGLIQDLTLEDLLVFITGADAIPPLGFDYPVIIAFYDMDSKSRRLPWSSTCSLTLNLPRGFEDAKQFNALICNALLNCYGFGKG